MNGYEFTVIVNVEDAKVANFFQDCKPLLAKDEIRLSTSAMQCEAMNGRCTRWSIVDYLTSDADTLGKVVAIAAMHNVAAG